MKVFISWSGERSHMVAQALRDWLPQVIQAIEPWISSLDLEKGARWSRDVSTQLEVCKVGIICLTPENMASPWVLFEAGALSKTLDSTYVCPYLYELEPAEVGQPLGQFQATKAERVDTQKLLHTLNQSLGEHALTRERLDDAFDRWWPDLEQELASIPTRNQIAAQVNDEKRSDRDLLEELISLVRSHDLGLQQLEMGMQELRSHLGQKGTFVLSDSLQQLAAEESIRLRRERTLRHMEVLAREEARMKSQYPPIHLVEDGEPGDD